MVDPYSSIGQPETVEAWVLEFEVTCQLLNVLAGSQPLLIGKAAPNGYLFVLDLAPTTARSHGNVSSEAGAADPHQQPPQRHLSI